MYEYMIVDLHRTRVGNRSLLVCKNVLPAGEYDECDATTTGARAKVCALQQLSTNTTTQVTSEAPAVATVPAHSVFIWRASSSKTCILCPPLLIFLAFCFLDLATFNISVPCKCEEAKPI